GHELTALGRRAGLEGRAHDEELEFSVLGDEAPGLARRLRLVELGLQILRSVRRRRRLVVEVYVERVGLELGALHRFPKTGERSVQVSQVRVEKAVLPDELARDAVVEAELADKGGTERRQPV